MPGSSVYSSTNSDSCSNAFVIAAVKQLELIRTYDNVEDDKCLGCVGKKCFIHEGGGVLVVQCWHDGLGTREPVVVVCAFVSSSIRAEPCNLGQGSCSG